METYTKGQRVLFHSEYYDDEVITGVILNVIWQKGHTDYRIKSAECGINRYPARSVVGLA